MSKPTAQRRAWQLPRGVSSGTWDYVAQPEIASQYDTFHGDHPLMKLDVQLVDSHLDQLLKDRAAESFLLADYGCGTSRIARHVQPRGIRTLNVDLSAHMLSEAAARLSSSSGNLRQHAFVHSNLVELDWLADASVDLAVCLFSSLGMIRGRLNRQCFLQHVLRTLKPGGVFLLHVHNRGHSWRDPTGPAWLISTFLKSRLRKDWELGDRVYVYRGLPQMFLHIFSRRELNQDLKAAGFHATQIQPVNITGTSLLAKRTLGEYFRAGGFFATARK